MLYNVVYNSLHLSDIVNQDPTASIERKDRDAYTLEVIAYQASCRLIAYPLYPVIEVSEPDFQMTGSCARILVDGEERVGDVPTL